jgi:hypothetical protein
VRAPAIVGLLVAGSLGWSALGVASGATKSKVAINTTVVTTLSNFEFNAYFGPPKSDISCEILHRFPMSGSRHVSWAYCMSATTTLVHHVTLSSSGVVTRCVGVRCGSNAGLGTPDLAPGTKVESGPFACVVTANAVTCKVATGRGFRITVNAISVL